MKATKDLDFLSLFWAEAKAMNNDFKNYDFEVYKKFDKWCNRYGWYATSESYTLQLFKI